MREDIEKVGALNILASSEQAGVFAAARNDYRQIFIMGHPEYDTETLNNEFIRDKDAGLNPEVPSNYFLNDDYTQKPVNRWRSQASLIYINWLNYVYQETPYDITSIS
ncbi:Homoserine O-acetyltransferase [bioreactor metagenome]|uniref:Homoserine O-acetyltransferase n=1 Tax=bioreactor metagenome TaxID=1076179 RepID=A0A645HQF0_9ZZZZ